MDEFILIEMWLLLWWEWLWWFIVGGLDDEFLDDAGDNLDCRDGEMVESGAAVFNPVVAVAGGWFSERNWLDRNATMS